MVASTQFLTIHATEYAHICQKLIANSMIRMIAACAHNRVMGMGGTLPWKIQKDWEHFLKITQKDALVMGRRCYEDFVEFAPERKVVALSRNPDLQFPHAEKAGNLTEGIEQAKKMARDVWICGGEEIYREAMPIAKELHLTLIEADFEGDTFFPDWTPHFAEEVDRQTTSSDGYDLTFLVLGK